MTSLHTSRRRGNARPAAVAALAALVAAVLSLGCGGSRADAESTAAAARRAAFARTAAHRDSASDAVARLDSLCGSAAAARLVLAAAARVDSQARADSVAHADSVALLDSIARRDTAPRTRALALRRAARARRAAATSPAIRLARAAWVGPVARRALEQAPLPGSLFPGCRVVAYYGNPLSRRMGILGEIQPDSMMARLDREADRWAAADSARHVLPALELIAVVAQASPGRDGMYRMRMPDTLIARVASWAERRGWLLILDVQVGRSSVVKEVAPLLPWLKKPYVHLALDPEFAMQEGKIPGRVIGTLDARAVNAVVDTLAALVSADSLPPKMLIVHRFTRPMVTNHERIHLDPRVQVVMDMDGFGAPQLKRSSYRHYIEDRPVQFTGFKLFYKNDRPLLTPEQVLRLMPVPLFIMYQ